MLSISLFRLKGTFFTLPIRQICIQSIPQPLIFCVIILEGKKTSIFIVDLKCKIIATTVSTYIKGVGPWQWKSTWAAVFTPTSNPTCTWPGERRAWNSSNRAAAMSYRHQPCTFAPPRNHCEHEMLPQSEANYWCAELRDWCC